MLKIYIKGIGILTGMIFGAGIFALPFALEKSGLFLGILYFLLTFGVLIVFHYLYAEIAYFSKNKNRFTGYVKQFLGKKTELFAFLITLGAYYGTLTAYGLLGGFFLSNFFSGKFPFLFSFLFFALGALLTFFNFQKIAALNFYLTLPLFGFIIYLFFISLHSINLNNFSFRIFDFFNKNSFLPYGIWLFSLSGFAVIPELKDITAGLSLKRIKNIILISLLLSSFFYWIFIITIIGICGHSTSPDALSGLLTSLGKKAVFLGSLMGFLAVFTSYLALAADLKNIYFYDFKQSRPLSWFWASFPPPLFFLLGAKNFTTILNLVGTIGLGFMGLLIILMSWKLKSSKISKLLKIIISLAILGAVFYEVLII